MQLVELWRYPVKSMRGEPLEAAEVRADGIEGDRLVHVVDGSGQLVTGRTRPGLLGLSATYNGTAHVDGAAWSSEDAAAAVERAAGEGARLVAADADGLRFDETPLLVATDGMAAAFGIDRRRLRPNILIGGVEGFAEREWEGRRMRVGETVIRLDHLCERCVMTTIDPDTLEIDADVLRRINAELYGRAALNTAVERPGRIAVGDPVELL